MLELSGKRILIVEDDQVFGDHLCRCLGQEGFEVEIARDGTSGLSMIQSQAFDLLLLDILLPGIQGLDLLGALRERQSVPVILISALGDEHDRITGFRYGADDYLPKPFSISELLVRIEAILRRVHYERERPVAATGHRVAFDTVRSDVTLDGQAVGLTPTEYRLLEVLVRHAGEVQSKAYLYQEVLHRGFSRHDRSLDMHVSNIRRKLARIDAQMLKIESVWGKGYLLRSLDGD